MDTAECILVTSCKGGVGKSTVSANLAAAYAVSGKKTVIIDCDFGMRCLDLIMGVSEKVVYDLYDVVFRDIPIARAAIPVRESLHDGLRLIAAPYGYSSVYAGMDSGGRKMLESGDFRRLVSMCRDELCADVVIIDTPGDISAPLVLAASVCTKAVVIATHQSASLRAAERTGAVLRELGVENPLLVINGYDSEAVKSGSAGVLDTIDKTGLRLCGVVPFDPLFRDAQDEGYLICDPYFTIRGRLCDGAQAVTNIKSRLEGDILPLFTGFRHPRAYKKSMLR